MSQPIPSVSQEIFRLECELALQRLFFDDATMLVIDTNFQDLEACRNAINATVKIDHLQHALAPLRISQT